MITFRPLAQAKYQRALQRMNVRHGAEYDCGRECATCEPFRLIEKAYWDSLSDEEKKSAHFWSWKCP